MKIPRKVIIDGRDWIIKRDPKSNGGCFDFGRRISPRGVLR